MANTSVITKEITWSIPQKYIDRYIDSHKHLEIYYIKICKAARVSKVSEFTTLATVAIDETYFLEAITCPQTRIGSTPFNCGISIIPNRINEYPCNLFYHVA